MQGSPEIEDVPENEEEGLPEVMKKFFPVPLNSPSQTDILQEMMNPANIEMKTRLIDVVGMSRLLTYAELLEKIGLAKSASTVKNFAINFMTCMVSKDGQGRKESIEALIGMRMNDTNDFGRNVIDNLNKE